MPDSNLTPGDRQQNRIDTERGLSDNGVRLSELRSSLVGFQQRVQDQRSQAQIQARALPSPPELIQLPPVSFPARQFSAPAQSGGKGQDALPANEIPMVIIVFNGTGNYCTLNGDIGAEV